MKTLSLSNSDCKEFDVNYKSLVLERNREWTPMDANNSFRIRVYSRSLAVLQTG